MKRAIDTHRTKRRPILSTLLCLTLAAGLWISTSPAAAAETGTDITDTEITRAVDGELMLARGVLADTIDVDTNAGIVTLAGTVDNILAKERATRVASMVKGVRAVVNNVAVHTPERPDHEIEQDILNALATDPATESWEVSVGVEDGYVALAGTVDSFQEKQLAERIAKGVRGVKSVHGKDLTIEYPESRTDYEIKSEIESALMWDSRIQDALIDVAVDDGEVRLSGTVGSAYEKSLAAAQARVPGTRSVDTENLNVEWWARDDMARQERFVDKSDEELARAVRDAFLYDPRVASFNPEVEVERGVVTLTGVVDNLKAKRAAAQDAANTSGVWRVKNYLKVRPVADNSDEAVASEIRGDLLLDPYVDRAEIGVSVNDGRARLTGTVDSYFERWQAEDIASRVRGVVRVDNRLAVDYEPLDYDMPVYDWDVVDYDYDLDYATLARPSDWEIQDNIGDELFWSPFVDADQVNVAVRNGVATLTGTVDSWSERNQATEEALEGGAALVDNNLAVEWGPDYLF